MRSCRGQLLTLEKFPGSHRSARAKGCPMKSIATRLETVSTCEAPPSLPLEKFHAKIPPFEKYFATILIADLDSRKIR